MFCSDWSLVKNEKPGLTVLPLRCRCWSCDECRPRRAAQLVAEAQAGAPTLFVTLTSRYKRIGSPHRAARALVAAWRRVRREYTKIHGKGSLPFLAVFEGTKKGWPHLHIVCRAKWIDQAWLSKRMQVLTGSPIVWVEAIKGQRKIAAYVAKYIGKNPEAFKGTKRYWRSLDYLLPAAGLSEPIGWDAPRWEIWRQEWRSIAEPLLWSGRLSERTIRALARPAGVPP